MHLPYRAKRLARFQRRCLVKGKTRGIGMDKVQKRQAPGFRLFKRQNNLVIIISKFEKWLATCLVLFKVVLGVLLTLQRLYYTDTH